MELVQIVSLLSSRFWKLLDSLFQIRYFSYYGWGWTFSYS